MNKPQFADQIVLFVRVQCPVRTCRSADVLVVHTAGKIRSNKCRSCGKPFKSVEAPLLEPDDDDVMAEDDFMGNKTTADSWDSCGQWIDRDGVRCEPTVAGAVPCTGFMVIKNSYPFDPEENAKRRRRKCNRCGFFYDSEERRVGPLGLPKPKPVESEPPVLTCLMEPVGDDPRIETERELEALRSKLRDRLEG